MNWRDEAAPKMNKETQVKNFIKNELMNYYFYLERRIECEETVKMYEEMCNDPSVGSSLAKMPEPSQMGLSPQERIVYNKADAESNLMYYEFKLETLDSWMNVLTEAQHDTVKVYVMKYQCEDIEQAASELNYQIDTVNKNTRRAIKRIYSNMKKIC